MGEHVDSRERRERYTCHIDVTLSETDEECTATASLSAPRGSFTGLGESHRNPSDPVVPLIGEELAIGRALVDLGNRLQRAGFEAVEDRESRPIHLVEVD